MVALADQLHALKYVTDTLSAARREQLPQVIPSLTSHLITCSEILCYTKAQNSQIAVSATSLVHKFKTQTSSLLQDKSLQGRWAAVVLIKATIDSVTQYQEGWDFLRISAAWIRGLLGILGKPDPVSTKTMTMVTITRIFLLTHGQPSLTREITTPHLASFITACLSLIATKSSEQGISVKDQSNGYLEVVLQCLIRLLPNHPAIFRPFSNQIRSLVASLIAPTPSDLNISESISTIVASRKSSALARHIHALLPSCAAKNGASEEWRRYVLTIIKQINQTADKAYRAVHEGVSNDHEEASDEPTDQIEDELMLMGWQGIAAGCERIRGLLSLLSAYLSTKGNINYQVPIKAIYEMAERLLSVSRPQNLVPGARPEGVNRQFSREERENLYLMLPHIQGAVLEVLSKMIDRMSLLSFSIAEDLLEQIAWIVQKSYPITDLQSIVYKVTEQIIGLIGASISAQKSTSVCVIIRMACKDLILEAIELYARNTSPNGSLSKPDYNADSFITNATSSPRKATTLQIHQKNALHLLCTALLRLPSSTLSSVRQEIDRVAVLYQHETLQLTSVLNPQASSRQQNANLVPFLAKSHDPLVEALIHRRLGAIVSRDNHEENDIAESEIVDLPVEPVLVVPTFNSDLTNNFQTVDQVVEGEVSIQTEDVEVINNKRAAGSTNLDNSIPENDELDRNVKKPRFKQGMEDQTARIDIPISTTEDDMSLDTTEADVPAPTMAVEVDTLNTGAQDSDSDDSFEIPEINVGLDDEDSQEEQD